MEKCIREAYESNFGTACETYEDAVKKGNSTRLQDVKNYSSKRDGIQVKSKPGVVIPLFHQVPSLSLKLI